MGMLCVTRESTARSSSRPFARPRSSPASARPSRSVAPSKARPSRGPSRGGLSPRSPALARLPPGVGQRAGSAISARKTTSAGTVDSALNNSTTIAVASLATSAASPAVPGLCGDEQPRPAVACGSDRHRVGVVRCRYSTLVRELFTDLKCRVVSIQVEKCASHRGDVCVGVIRFVVGVGDRDRSRWNAPRRVPRVHDVHQ